MTTTDRNGHREQAIADALRRGAITAAGAEDWRRRYDADPMATTRQLRELVGVPSVAEANAAPDHDPDDPVLAADFYQRPTT